MNLTPVDSIAVFAVLIAVYAIGRAYKVACPSKAKLYRKR